MTILASESSDLHARQWSPTSPVVLPWTIGVSPGCTIIVAAVNRGSSDVFQSAMIAQRAALIVNHCMDNQGGVVSLGPREQFQVQVLALAPRASA